MSTSAAGLGDSRLLAKFNAVAQGLGKQGHQIRDFPAGREIPNTLARKAPEHQTIVGAANTAVELGHPVTRSICLGLVTGRGDLISENRVRIIGKDLDELSPGRHSLALVLAGQVEVPGESARRVLLKSIMSLDSLEGCMVRTSAQRIWIRFSPDILNRGLTLKDLGFFILSDLQKDEVIKAEITLITGKAAEINEFQVVAETLARQRSVRYQEALVERLSCEGALDCDVCPENRTCKVLKAAVAVSRRKAKP